MKGEGGGAVFAKYMQESKPIIDQDRSLRALSSASLTHKSREKDTQTAIFSPVLEVRLGRRIGGMSRSRTSQTWRVILHVVCVVKASAWTLGIFYTCSFEG